MPINFALRHFPIFPLADENATKTCAANLTPNLFAQPGIAFASCTTIGLRNIAAAR